MGGTARYVICVGMFDVKLLSKIGFKYSNNDHHTMIKLANYSTCILYNVIHNATRGKPFCIASYVVKK